MENNLDTDFHKRLIDFIKNTNHIFSLGRDVQRPFGAVQREGSQDIVLWQMRETARQAPNKQPGMIQWLPS